MLVAVRTATTLHRLLDSLQVFAGDDRVEITFTVVPGSDFDMDALAALGDAADHRVPWEQACADPGYQLILAASPNGIEELSARCHDAGRPVTPLVLLPHGAGFNKRHSAESATGLSSAQLMGSGTRPLAALHALAHPDQLARLAAESPAAAARATVVGDPTLERMDASTGRRAAYRAALGTGSRQLVVVTTTWGRESLLYRRPTLPHRLVSELPLDGYQVALVLHPNEHSRRGAYELRRVLDPALRAGLLVAAPFQEWAAVLLAADLVVTDHGSTALYAAAQGTALLNAYEGGEELLPESPLGGLLRAQPALAHGHPLTPQIAAAVRGRRPEAVRRRAAGAFAARGEALDRLRTELYAVLGLSPPAGPEPPEPAPLPLPTATDRTPVTACAVRTGVSGHRVAVTRHPLSGVGPPGDHVAADTEFALLRPVQNAAVLYRYARPDAAPGVRWTAADWTADVLDRYPLCRTTAVLLSPGHCLVGRRDRAGLLSVALPVPPADQRRPGEPLVRHDPAAVVSAVHAWLEETQDAALPARLDCHIGGLGDDGPATLPPVTAVVTPADPEEAVTPV